MKPYSRFFKCEYFKIQELVDPETFKIHGENAWQFFDQYTLSTLDRMRMRWGPITVNNWHLGGPFKYRGFRPRSCTVGSDLSMHRLGKAFDCDVNDKKADDVRAEILKDKEHIDFMFITRMEIGISWLHFDTANIANRIQLFTPPKAKV